MRLKNLNDVFVHQIKDLYSAEEQLTRALPKLAERASSEQLRSAFQEHLQQTERQRERLQRIAELMDLKVTGETCQAMKGLIKEGEELLEDNEAGDALDAAMIAAAQRVEHYEIAAYGSACTYAKQLGHEEALKLLKETLDEEEKTDKRLTRIAEGSVNQAAQNHR